MCRVRGEDDSCKDVKIKFGDSSVLQEYRPDYRIKSSISMTGHHLCNYSLTTDRYVKRGKLDS